MRLRFAFVGLCSVACASWMFAQGCGGDTSPADDGGSDGTTGGDSNPPPPQDSGGDVNPGDTGAPDTGPGDAGDGGVQPDGASSNVSFRCAVDGGTVTDCSQCQGFPQPCVYCETADASTLTGQCRTMGTSCFQNAPQGYGACPCSAGDASTCPESYQVCRSFANNPYSCRTCSDSTNNNGLTCQNGGTCNNVDGGCN
ncbi:MAG TPA: hypothetical protein VLM85_14580 [Polyangiaceae bacterium]|nr:hypothetical protein [Polyangiaceae bacterium]